MDARIERIFREVLEDNHLVVTEDVTPENTPAWDSFAQVNLIVELEEEFGVKFSMDEVVHMQSVRSVLEALVSKGIQISKP